MNKKWSEKSINRSKPIQEKAKPQNTIIIPSLLTEVNSIEDLYTYINKYEIPMRKNQKTVISSGPLNAEIMIIGEAPGKSEDEQGLPFVGESGILVDSILNQNGIKRESVYVTNVLFWRPDGNRTPNDMEIQLMRPILYKHIELYNPKIILLLGSVALRAIFDNKYTITKIRGELLEFNGFKVIASFHPSYILRNKSMQKYMEKDFQMLANIIHNPQTNNET